MLSCYTSSEVPNVVPCGLELIVSLILCSCMLSIANHFLGMGIQNAIRNTLLLLLIVTFYPRNEIAKTYPFVVCVL